ncbi:MAG TPA: beta-ketoacyl-[acyl-carrier-protein] synthase II [Verrucomicrobia bacterium]|nr:MAG: beta-ketoacyl-[acyl-carrier-protein] synthase II [Lentisphaerae bacterium GWF2_57_35]HBA83177.1 beta-ketoacyl-[acyl-carrier-protein] synthase II [Verrucomicrobiota bacterium]
MAGRRVVVTGLGVVSPLGCALDKFWDRLIHGQSGVRPIQTFDVSRYPSKIAGEVVEFDIDAFISKKEQRRMDPFSHYGIAAAKMAVTDSGLALDQENTERIGVVVGSGIGGLQVLQEQHGKFMQQGPSRFSPFMIPQMITNIVSGLIAIEHGLKGPNFCVVSACASGTHSLGESLRIIQHGEADVMLAGGAEAPMCDLGVGGFCAMRALSTRNDDPQKASRPFDADRDGFVIGEGAGVLVLEELEHAQKRGARIYCELAGYGRTCDAFHMTAPDDQASGASRGMKLAFEDAGLTAEGIDYINAHGTSTELNDKCETLAIKKAFGEELARKVMISSTKSMTGHLLGAAGAIESAICALVLQNGIIPPTINYTTPDPFCDLDYVPNTAREVKVRACLNNSLGFGGHNATLCFKAM